MNAVILSVGDELILGQTVDTNSAWLSAQLVDQGVMVAYHKTVADDQAAIAAAIREAVEGAPLVIVTGGLGPTADDLTRQALADVVGKPLDLHPPSLHRIRAFFKALGREMPVTNRIQAMVPRGSEMLDNDWGTAPGLKIRKGRATVFAFPGVPREMVPMFERYVLPTLARKAGRTILTETLRTFGAGESTVAETLGELMRRDGNPMVGTTVSGGIVSVRIRSDFPNGDQARRHLERVVAVVEARLGTLVFGRGTATLPSVVGQRLREAGRTVTTAESCTGGWLARLLTDSPGASQYYVGGWVVYSNVMKHRELRVSEAVLAEHGAVSEETVRLLATHARDKAGADYALAVSGVAGPDGGSEAKPVGTVWIALALGQGPGAKVVAERFQFPGDREMVRDRAAKMALNMLRLELDKPA
jgi:nicotinamide-nucleotide amidase